MFCTKMLKYWIVLALFAMPIISQETNEKLDKFGFPENIDRLECKNSSAVVLEKQENLYQEFVKCVRNTVDIKLLNQDIRFILRTIITALKFNSALSDQQISSLRLYSQSYCPKLATLINCEETYSTIYVDCFTAAEVQAKKIKRDTVHQLIDYFCENNAEEFINFINGKFVECGLAKQFQLKGCLKSFFATIQTFPDNVQLTTNSYCKSIDGFFDCITSIFQQCELSQTPGKLLESLHSYIKSHGICSNDGTMKLKMSLL